jgi:hypothetical protein
MRGITMSKRITILFRKIDGSYQTAVCHSNLRDALDLRVFLRGWITEHLPDGSVVLAADIDRSTSPTPNLSQRRIDDNNSNKGEPWN